MNSTSVYDFEALRLGGVAPAKVVVAWRAGRVAALHGGPRRGSGRAQVTRAVLEGVAHRGADLVAAAEAGTGHEVPVLRVDGGMSANPTFVQALANASSKTVEVSRHAEATTIGAGYLAGLAVGVWSSFDDIGESWKPARVVSPDGQLDRDQWAEAVERSKRWIPDLSALDF